MSARFASVKKPAAMARDFLPPEKRPAAYGYPARRASVRYHGLGRDERDLYDALAPDASEQAVRLVSAAENGETDMADILSSLSSARLFASAFDDADEYELMYLAAAGDPAEVPDGFELLGYDVSYPPGDELFSAVADLFFYPIWHGADPTGKSYAAEYALLNRFGLFSDAASASAFRDRYAADFDEEDLCVVVIYAESSRNNI